MKFTREEYDLLHSKLEYRFKNSGNEIINKLKNYESLTVDDTMILLKKLEYNFKKSENPIIEKLKNSK